MSVTLTELKSHLRITDTGEDTVLQIYLDSALDWVENQTGQKLSRDTRTAYFDCFGDLELIGDSPSAITVSYIDDNGDSQDVSGAVYALKTHKARPYITLAYNQSWPSSRAQDAAVSVAYTSGYTVSTLPSSLKSAVLLVAGDFYEFREAKTIVRTYENMAAERLMRPYKIITL